MPTQLAKNQIVPKLFPCSWMRGKEKFFFLDSDQAFLVLYILASQDALRDFHSEAGINKSPLFTNPKDWVNIMHQTAGYACHHYYIYARFLEPKNSIKGLLEALPLKYNDSCISRNTSLETAVEYEKLLNSYKLSCNFSYMYLEEGFYPIDISCIKKVTNERFPEDLQALVEKPKVKKNEKLWSFFNRQQFGLAILGPNCD